MGPTREPSGKGVIVSVWNALCNGPLHAGATPIRVWVVDHALTAPHRALTTRPFPGFPDLVWALVEATCVARGRTGINVDFTKGGITGWFPSENVRFNHPGRKELS